MKKIIKITMKAQPSIADIDAQYQTLESRVEIVSDDAIKLVIREIEETDFMLLRTILGQLSRWPGITKLYLYVNTEACFFKMGSVLSEYWAVLSRVKVCVSKQFTQRKRVKRQNWHLGERENPIRLEDKGNELICEEVDKNRRGRYIKNSITSLRKIGDYSFYLLGIASVIDGREGFGFSLISKIWEDTLREKIASDEITKLKKFREMTVEVCHRLCNFYKKNHSDQLDSIIEEYSRALLPDSLEESDHSDTITIFSNSSVGAGDTAASSSFIGVQHGAAVLMSMFGFHRPSPRVTQAEAGAGIQVVSNVAPVKKLKIKITEAVDTLISYIDKEYTSLVSAGMVSPGGEVVEDIKLIITRIGETDFDALRTILNHLRDWSKIKVLKLSVNTELCFYKVGTCLSEFKTTLKRIKVELVKSEHLPVMAMALEAHLTSRTTSSVACSDMKSEEKEALFVEVPQLAASGVLSRKRKPQESNRNWRKKQRIKPLLIQDRGILVTASGSEHAGLAGLLALRGFYKASSSAISVKTAAEAADQKPESTLRL